MLGHSRLQYILAIASLCLLLLGTPTSAQQLQTARYAESRGLPDLRLSDLEQSTDGLMWFAAHSGAYAFDGARWESFLAGEDLPEGFVPERLAAGSNGRMYVLPQVHSHGLGYYENGDWQLLQVPMSNAPGRRSNRELAVLSDGDGNDRVIIAEPDRIIAWNGEQWNDLKRGLGRDGSRIFSIASQGSTLFVGSDLGVEVLPPESLSLLSTINLPDGEGPVVAIDATKVNGKLRIWIVTPDWIGRSDGPKLTKLPTETDSFDLSGIFATHLLDDRHGGLFLGTHLQLWKLEQETGEKRQLGILEGMVSEGATGLMLDRDQNVWVSCLRGATQVPPQMFESYTRDQGLAAIEVTAIEEIQPGVLLIGHINHLSLLEDGRVTRTITIEFPDLGNGEVLRVLDICRDENGGAWIASGIRGVLHWSPTDGLTRVELENPTYTSSICYGADGKLMVGTAKGLQELRNNTLIPIPQGEQETDIRRLFSFEDGRLYLARTLGGLALWENGEWSTVISGEMTLRTNIYAVHQQDDKQLLLGTSAGLFELREGELRRLRGKRFISAPVYSILQTRDGNLWFGTGSGTKKWDGELLHEYGQDDGLLGFEVNRDALIEDSQSQVWIGTTKGLSRSLNKNFKKVLEPRVEILGATIQGEEVRLGEGIELHSYSDVEFRLRAISFSSLRVPSYRARLVGLESEWIPARPISNNMLRYTNLPPGNYRLEMQARGERSDWGPVTSSPSFTVLTPYWQQWWFLAATLGALCLLIFFFASFRDTRKRSAGLAVQVREQDVTIEVSERRYREMFEMNPAIQLLLDPSTGRVLEANTAAANYFGNLPQDLQGQDLSELTGIAPKLLTQGLETLESTAEWVIRPAEKDPIFGPPIEIRTSLYPLRGEKVVQATIYDIEMRQHLEQQLLESQKLQAVGELARGVAHDFNNLLTAILGTNELIAIDCRGDNKLSGHLERIRDAGESGANLVKKLMNFARRQELLYEELNINEVITQASTILRSAVGSRIELNMDLDDSADLVRVDRNQIERALINIALNARDAMPDGGKLFLSTAQADPADMRVHAPEFDPEVSYLRMSIQDTGSGMTPEVRRRAFEPFFTTRSADKRSGLGLSTVHGIIGQYGGFTDIETSAEKGTCIHMYLPMVTDNKGRAVEPTVPKVFPAELVHDQTVLLVEDDDAVRGTICVLLTGTGHRVLEAASAGAARALYDDSKGSIDIVLSDLRLPDMSGRDLGRSLQEERPNLPIIYMSGYYDEAIKSENEIFIMKPFSLDKLKLALLQAGLIT